MSNNLQLINEIWKVLKPSIEIGDVDEAAENLVSYLVDEAFDPEDINQQFRTDREIKKKISYYLDSEEETHDEDLEDFDFGYDKDDDDY